MPNIKSAVKRMRQSEARNAQRSSQKSALRTTMKAAEEVIANGSVEEAKAALTKAQRQLDKAVSKRLLHRNAAARYKSRLAKKLHDKMQA